LRVRMMDKQYRKMSPDSQRASYGAQKHSVADEVGGQGASRQSRCGRDAYAEDIMKRLRKDRQSQQNPW
jgi:hypothetical protein